MNVSDSERINLYAYFFAKPWLPGETHYLLYTPNQLLWTFAESGFKDMVTMPARYPGMEDCSLKMSGIK